MSTAAFCAASRRSVPSRDAMAVRQEDILVRHTEMAPSTSSAAQAEWVQKLRSYPPGSSRRPTTQDAAPGVRLDIDSDMRKVFERALRGRKIFGTPALQGGGGRGQVEKVALCWQAFCRVCATAMQRGHAVKVGSIATLWPDEHAGAGSTATHAAFDVAFLRRCQLQPPKAALPIHLHRTPAPHPVATAEVAQWCGLAPGVCGQVLEAVASAATDLVQSGDIEALDLWPVGLISVGRCVCVCVCERERERERESE